MDKDEKEHRKTLLNELRQKQKQEFEEGLPMGRDFFEKLFNHLDNQLAENDCNHTNNLTMKFLENNQISSIENVLNWLADNGGYCDCEILANVEEKFE